MTHRNARPANHEFMATLASLTDLHPVGSVAARRAAQVALEAARQNVVDRMARIAHLNVELARFQKSRRPLEMLFSPTARNVYKAQLREIERDLEAARKAFVHAEVEAKEARDRMRVQEAAMRKRAALENGAEPHGA